LRIKSPIDGISLTDAYLLYKGVIVGYVRGQTIDAGYYPKTTKRIRDSALVWARSLGYNTMINGKLTVSKVPFKTPLATQPKKSPGRPRTRLRWRNGGPGANGRCGNCGKSLGAHEVIGVWYCPKKLKPTSPPKPKPIKPPKPPKPEFKQPNRFAGLMLDDEDEQ
jgi:hypothetical protein